MWINFLLLFTITNKIILGLILLFGKVKHLSDKLLGIIVILPVAVFINDMLFYNRQYYTFMPFLNQLIIHCMSPCIYIYCLQQIDLTKKVPGNAKYLFLSVLIPAGCWIYFLLYTDEESTRLFLKSLVGEERYFLTEILNTAIEFQIIGITVYTYYKITQFARHYNYKNSFINVQLNWSKQFLRLIIVLSVC